MKNIEYIIPEGMEAIIENGKVIFREKESEDEKIRKELIEYLTVTRQQDFVARPERQRWIAYLEKQKEQSFTHHKIDESLRDAVAHQMLDDGDVDDFVRRGIDDIVLKYAELGAKWQKEQKSAEIDEYKIIKKHITEDILSSEVNKRLKECGWFVTDEKPAEWREEDKEILQQVIADIEDLIAAETSPGFLDKYNKHLEWLQKRFKSLRPQLSDEDIKKIRSEEYTKGFNDAAFGGKLNEWSEEDEKMRQSIIKDIEWERNYTSATTGKVIERYNEQINWLKFFPGRINPQPKQEWGEDDNSMLENCIEAIGSMSIRSDVGDLRKWLRSIPERFNPGESRTKSEEEMQVLETAIAVIDLNIKKDAQITTKVTSSGYIRKEDLINRLKSIHHSWEPGKKQIGTSINYSDLLSMLLEAIDYSFLRTDGTYDKSLTYPVIDKVNFIKKQLLQQRTQKSDSI